MLHVTRITQEESVRIHIWLGRRAIPGRQMGEGCVRGKDRIDGRILGGRERQEENKESGSEIQNLQNKGKRGRTKVKRALLSHQCFRAVHSLYSGFWLMMVVH